MKERTTQLTDEIHQKLSALQVYDKFRSCHSLIKDCLYAKNFNEMSVELQNAIEAVHAVLYLAESQAVDDDGKGL